MGFLNNAGLSRFYDAIQARFAEKSQLPNRNLLDNWDFRNPVNQRGAASYAGAGYTIDRWKINGGTLTLTDAGLTLTNGQVLCQPAERTYDTTKRYTASFIDGSGGIHTLTGVDGTYRSLDGLLACCIINNVVYFRITNNSVVIAAVKLELGGVSTLAADPLADYGAELAKCQRYYRLWTTATARTAALCEVGLMRTSPALSTVAVSGTTYYAASADL